MTTLRRWVAMMVITGALQNAPWPPAERPWTSAQRTLVPRPAAPCGDMRNAGVDKGDAGKDCQDR